MLHESLFIYPSLIQVFISSFGLVSSMCSRIPSHSGATLCNSILFYAQFLKEASLHTLLPHRTLCCYRSYLSYCPPAENPGANYTQCVAGAVTDLT